MNKRTLCIILLVITIVVIIIIFCNKNENFYTVSYQDHSILTFPLFLNLYPDNLSFNSKRFEFLQKLKFLNPIKRNTLQNNYNIPYANINSGFIANNIKNVSPVIIIPGLGTSVIKAKWQNKISENFYTPDKEDAYIDREQNFTCKENQYEYKKIWYDCSMVQDKYGKYCWGDLAKVYAKDGQIINSPSVKTYVPNNNNIQHNIEPSKYLNNLIETFLNDGYVLGANLFIATYDFRRMGDHLIDKQYYLFLQDLIEKLNKTQNNKVTLIGHDLGTIYSNLFLNSAVSNEWKDKHIKETIYIAPSMGGCPKALRVYLSGESWFANKESNRIFKETVRNYSGLLFMLPNPDIYKDKEIVNYPPLGTRFNAKHIPDLMIELEDSNGYHIYKDNVYPLLDKTIQYPDVNLTIISGKGHYTESNYTYINDLETNPQKTAPHNTLEKPYGQQTRFPSQFQGDGTIPEFVTHDIVSKWNKEKSGHTLKFYSMNIEHTALTKSEPVLKICLDTATK